MELRGFHHLAIQVRDLEQTAVFYREVVGLLELARHHRDDRTLRAIWLGIPGGGFLALEHCAGELPDEGFRRDTPGYLMLALRIAREDRAELLAHLARKGVHVEHQTRWTVYVRDPEGNRIGFSHHPDDPI